MSDSSLYAITLFEHRFWLQILGDHSRFILIALPSEEEKKVKKTKYFINLFDSLLDKARGELSREELNSLTDAAYNAACEIRKFKLSILKELLVDKVKFNLTPTFLNHMVNEVEEYMINLNFIMKGQIPLALPIHHHLVWLPDGAGHASAISASLDKVEKDLMKTSNKFSKTFDELSIKSAELFGYMRTSLTEFPALNRLNNQAELEMTSFKKFLCELRELVSNKKVLSRLTPLMPDHMYREECYYLTKLSQSSGSKLPQCDPTKPRIEE